MKNSVKRLLALILTIAMIASMLPVVFAAEEAEASQVLTEDDYADIDALWDEIDEYEEIYAKKGADQTALADAAYEKVLASDNYVEGSIERNGNTFTWMTEEGIRCIYDPYMRDKKKNMVAPEEALADGAYNEPVATKGGSPSSNQVYLVAPYYGYDSSFTDQYKNEADSIADAIGDTDGYTLYSGSAATVDKVATAISNGAVVIFDSHGITDYSNGDDYVSGATNSYLCLNSNSGITSADYNDGCMYGSGYAYINGETISNHMTSDSPGGILWMAICLGMATDALCGPMRDRGVEVVYGYSQSVTFTGDYKYETYFWNYMKAGKTVAQAASYMKSASGCNWDPAYSSYSQSQAVNNYVAFPVVVSDEDSYPSNPDSVQTVKSTYTLFGSSSSGSSSSGSSSSSSESITIKFSCPDGVSASSISTTADTAFTLPTPSGSPSADAYSYTFVGWATSTVSATTTAPTTYAAGKSVSASSSLTLYAVYKYTSGSYTYYTTTLEYAEEEEAESITIKFSCPSGVSASSINTTAGTAFTLPSPSGTPDADAYSYTFVGWATSTVSATTTAPTTYAAGKSVSASSSLTLYAVYKYTKSSYTYYTTTLEYAEEDDTAESITIKFSCPSGVSASSINTTSGTNFTLPTPSGTPDADAYSYSFVGWATSTVSATTTAPTTYAAGKSVYATSSLTLYAVYSYTKSGYTYYTTTLEYAEEEDEASYTVSFVVPSGVSAVSSITGSSVTLPTPSGTPSNSNGASFIGWATGSVNNSTTKPTIYTAGTTYSISGNLTLYAVYSYTTGSGSSSSVEPYAAGDTGKYVIAAKVGSTYYALPTSPTVSSGKIKGTSISVSTASDGTLYVTSSNASGYTWNIAKGSYGYTISDGSKYLYHSNGGYSGTNLAYGTSTSYNWSISVSGDYVKMYAMRSSTTYSRGILYRSSYGFGGYALSNASYSGYYNIMLLPVAGSSSGSGTTYYTTVFSASTACSHSSTSTNTVAATCTTAGSVTVTCNSCGAVVSTSTIAATGHNYATSVTAPTCTAQGYTTYTCKTCSYSYKGNYTSATGHSYVNGVCTSCGASNGSSSGSTTGTYTLVEQGDTLTDGQYILLAESWGSYSDASYYNVYNYSDDDYTALASKPASYSSVPSTISANSSMVWTVTVSGSTITLRNAEGNYAYDASSSGAAVGLRSSSYSWTVTRYNDNSVALKSGNSRYLSLRDDLSTVGSNGYSLIATSSSVSTSGSYGSGYFYLYRLESSSRSISFTDNGDGTHTSSDGITEAHSYKNGCCICGAKENAASDLSFSKMALSLQACVEGQFAINTAALADYSDFYVSYRTVAADGTATETTDSGMAYAETYRVFCLPMAATAMADTVEITIYGCKDGQWIKGESYEWSIAAAAKEMLADSDNAARNTLLVDMLIYGAAAQIYFDYNTENLATAILSEAEMAYASADLAALNGINSEAAKGNGVSIIRSALSLGSIIEMQFAIDTGDYAAADLEARISYMANGEEITVIIDGADFIDYNGATVIAFNELTAKDLRTAITMEIYEKATDSCVSSSLIFSAEAFAAEIIAEDAASAKAELCKAMMKYADAAKAYFG